VSLDFFGLAVPHLFSLTLTLFVSPQKRRPQAAQPALSSETSPTEDVLERRSADRAANLHSENISLGRSPPHRNRPNKTGNRWGNGGNGNSERGAAKWVPPEADPQAFGMPTGEMRVPAQAGPHGDTRVGPWAHQLRRDEVGWQPSGVTKPTSLEWDSKKMQGPPEALQGFQLAGPTETEDPRWAGDLQVPVEADLPWAHQLRRDEVGWQPSGVTKPTPSEKKSTGFWTDLW